MLAAVTFSGGASQRMGPQRFFPTRPPVLEHLLDVTRHPENRRPARCAGRSCRTAKPSTWPWTKWHQRDWKRPAQFDSSGAQSLPDGLTASFAGGSPANQRESGRRSDRTVFFRTRQSSCRSSRPPRPPGDFSRQLFPNYTLRRSTLAPAP